MPTIAPRRWTLPCVISPASAPTRSGTTGAEIVAYDARTRRAFAINSTDNDLAVLDLTDPAAPILRRQVSFDAYGAGLNSVAAPRRPGRGRGRGEPEDEAGQGRIPGCAHTADRGCGHRRRAARHADLRRTTASACWSPTRASRTRTTSLTRVNPEGSVSIIDLERGVANASVRTADFRGVHEADAAGQGRARLRSGCHRRAGPRARVHHVAWPHGLGHPAGGQRRRHRRHADGDRAGDRPARSQGPLAARATRSTRATATAVESAQIKIANWPVFGLYQPDAIAALHVGQTAYLVTANEGDSRSSDDFPGFNEEVRVGSVAAYVLDPTAFPNAATSRRTPALGRLTVTNASGDTDGDGDFDRIDAFGARSFSIWTTAGRLVWDSGDQFEQFFGDSSKRLHRNLQREPRQQLPRQSQRQQGAGTRRRRDRPVGGRSLRLRRPRAHRRRDGLRRQRTPMRRRSPHTPTRASSTRSQGDLGAEGVDVRRRRGQPNGQPLVLVGNEVSRTVSIFQVEAQSRGNR